MRNLYTAICFLSVITLATSAFGQQATLTPEVLDSLYAERLQLSSNNQDYSRIEQEISRSGVYPSVLAEKTIEAQGTRYSFKIYTPISGSGNQESMERRFQSMFPEIQFIDIQENHVDVLMSPAITNENLDLFFFYFGYKNIQLKN